MSAPARRGRLVRALLAVGALLVAAPFVPLPERWDPRLEEVADERLADLARFGGARTRAEVEAALRVVDPDGLLAPYHTLTDTELAVRLDPGAPVLRIPLRAAPAPAAPVVPRRVALDPGHFGGAWSRLEKRHATVDGGPAVKEGDLAWATARLAERDLRQDGVDVHLLRGPPPEGPYPADADPAFDVGVEAGQRLAEDAARRPPWLAPLWGVGLWQERARLARDTPFDLYVRYDLRRRAAASAAFGADVTVSLHYNYGGGDQGVLVFVPGAFVAGELTSRSQRFWAYRRALDGTLDETLRWARAFSASLQRHLALPPGEVDAQVMRTWRPVDPSRGIYARNLALLRRTPGVVVLLEGPTVNHPDEYGRLQGREIEVDGRGWPTRVRQYADAVVEVLRQR